MRLSRREKKLKAERKRSIETRKLIIFILISLITIMTCFVGAAYYGRNRAEDTKPEKTPIEEMDERLQEDYLGYDLLYRVYFRRPYSTYHLVDFERGICTEVSMKQEKGEKEPEITRIRSYRLEGNLEEGWEIFEFATFYTYESKDAPLPKKSRRKKQQETTEEAEGEERPQIYYVNGMSKRLEKDTEYEIVELGPLTKRIKDILLDETKEYAIKILTPCDLEEEEEVTEKVEKSEKPKESKVKERFRLKY